MHEERRNNNVRKKKKATPWLSAFVHESSASHFRAITVNFVSAGLYWSLPMRAAIILPSLRLNGLVNQQGTSSIG